MVSTHKVSTMGFTNQKTEEAKTLRETHSEHGHAVLVLPLPPLLVYFVVIVFVFVCFNLMWYN